MSYIRTSFSQAVLQFFENLDSHLKQNHSELQERAVDAYIFGGCAVHMHIGTRTSDDVDAEIQTIPQLKHENLITKAIQSVEFDDEQGLPQRLMWDGGFKTSLGSVAFGYECRAKQIHITKSKLVYVYLVSAVDIAVSKLGRSSSRDLEDIKDLYRNSLFTLRDFEELADEAITDCCVAPDKLKFNIKIAIDILKEVAQ